LTTNINLEINYWQADAGDLWEMEEPLWSLIRYGETPLRIDQLENAVCRG
jgi:hypothetical protein